MSNLGDSNTSDIKKRERTTAYPAPFFPSPAFALKGRTTIIMIRLFTALCKSMLENLTDENIFHDVNSGYRGHSETCPRCGTAGKTSGYGDYGRWLTSFENGNVIDRRVSPKRVKCGSCGATHAILPDIIMPYSPYSLRFVLSVLIAYFERDVTVLKICDSYNIAVSTLYRWKKRVASHKELMLGILINRKTPTLAFIRNLLNSDRLSYYLRRFFRKYGFSFMQNQSKSTLRSRPP